MFKNNYISTYLNKTKINKKVDLLLWENNMNKPYLYNLELILNVPSAPENRQRFIIMLILMERFLNNSPKFLIDTRTLSRSKSIKIGCIINLSSEMLHQFLNLNTMHNIPKFYNNEIIFEFTNTYFMRYEIKKILSNLVFHFDKDITYYYDYLNEFDYNITFFFKSIFKNPWYNRLFLSQCGIYFNNYLSSNVEDVILSSWYDSLIEEEETENVSLNENNQNDKNTFDYVSSKSVELEENIIDSNLILKSNF